MEKLHFTPFSVKSIIAISLLFCMLLVKGNHIVGSNSIIGNWCYIDYDHDSLYVECYFINDSTYISFDLEAGDVLHYYKICDNNLSIYRSGEIINFRVNWINIDEIIISDTLNYQFHFNRLFYGIDISKLQNENHELMNEFYKEFLIREENFKSKIKADSPN